MQNELMAAARDPLGSTGGGRQVATESLHVTLAFLGSVPEASLEAVKECARVASEACRIAPPGLQVMLDVLDYWPRSQVLCATSSRESAGAAELAEGLERALCAAGFTPDLKPLRVHVTLARRVRRCSAGGRPPPGALLQVRWTFAEFSLAESRPASVGSTYSVLGAWPLCGS